MFCKSCTVLGVCAAGALIAAVAIAQPSDKKPDPKDQPKDKAPAHQPGKDDKGKGMPEMSPEMEKMMEECAKAATPGPMHERLTSGTGVWDGKVKSYMDPEHPSESKCVTTIKSVMGGRFTHGNTEGMMDMGGPEPTKFEGFGVYGYNNSTQKFECIWTDTMGTMMQVYKGELSKDGKTLIWNTKYFDPMFKKESWMRLEETQNGPDSMTLKMFGPNMEDQTKEAKYMEIEYTRRAGTGPKAATSKPAAAK